MLEKELKLLFENGALSKCVVSMDSNGVGYNALFVKKGEKSTSMTLDTQKRKAGDISDVRVFKTIDAACSLVKRKIGFQDFFVTKI